MRKIIFTMLLALANTNLAEAKTYYKEYKYDSKTNFWIHNPIGGAVKQVSDCYGNGCKDDAGLFGLPFYIVGGAIKGTVGFFYDVADVVGDSLGLGLVEVSEEVSGPIENVKAVENQALDQALNSLKDICTRTEKQLVPLKTILACDREESISCVATTVGRCE